MHEKCYLRSLSTNTKKPVARTSSAYTFEEWNEDKLCWTSCMPTVQGIMFDTA